VIAIAGVLFLAAAGVGVAVLSAVVAKSPERAAMMVVLAAAGAGMATLPMLLVSMAVLGLGGAPQPGPPAVVVMANGSMPRLAAGMALAATLLVVAGRLIRSGDWERPEDDILDR
jgi:hypothetical protein